MCFPLHMGDVFDKTLLIFTAPQKVKTDTHQSITVKSIHLSLRLESKN